MWKCSITHLLYAKQSEGELNSEASISLIYLAKSHLDLKKNLQAGVKKNLQAGV